MPNLLSRAAARFAGLLRNRQTRGERTALFVEMSARELREYGLRCCPPGSIQDRRVYDLRLLGF